MPAKPQKTPKTCLTTWEDGSKCTIEYGHTGSFCVSPTEHKLWKPNAGFLFFGILFAFMSALLVVIGFGMLVNDAWHGKLTTDSPGEVAGPMFFGLVTFVATWYFVIQTRAALASRAGKQAPKRLIESATASGSRLVVSWGLMALAVFSTRVVVQSLNGGAWTQNEWYLLALTAGVPAFFGVVYSISAVLRLMVAAFEAGDLDARHEHARHVKDTKKANPA